MYKQKKDHTKCGLSIKNRDVFYCFVQVNFPPDWTG